MTQLLLQPSSSPVRSLSPYLEMGAYEVLWSQEGATFKRIADRFRAEPDALPSDLVTRAEALKMAGWVTEHLRGRGVRRFGVRVHRAGEYPQKLRDARHPVELLYYQGIWNLVEAPSVAVVGTRKPTKEGVKRARQLVRDLVRADYTIVSGLAQGIDTAAHTAALDLNAPTIAVIGTPLGRTYPASNQELQRRLARDHLLVSQVPVYRYEQQHVRQNRLFFPERNRTMAALTRATVIVEAGETSGTLIQARAALQQGRKVFIMASAFRRGDLTWPARLEKQGAIRLEGSAQLIDCLRQDG